MAEPGRPMFPVFSSRRSEVWQVGAVRLPLWMTAKGSGKPSRVWIAACLNVETEDLVPSDGGTEDEIPALVETVLSRAGWKWRSSPARVEAADPRLAGILESLLAPYGIPVETAPELPPLREFLSRAAERSMPDDPRPSPLTGAGVTLERLAAFARAAADFYASSFWHHLTADDLIRVEAPEVEGFQYLSLSRAGGGRLSVVMFFPEIQVFEMLMDGEFDELRAAGKELWNLELAPVWEAPPSDLDLWERYGLPWVGENRCPVVCRLGPGDVERPDGRQLAFVEGLLAALAATAEEEIDTGRWRRRAATSEGRMDFVLSLPGLLEPEEAPAVKPAFSWRASERSLREIGKLLRAREYASLEEANEAIARYIKEGSPEPEPETPEERAEELMDLAWDMPGRRAVLLARRALEIWPDCADAYNLLASRAIDPEASRQLYERGVAAGERALGAEVFREEAGHFWGLVETRPYMRARQGLAESLVELKRFAEAAEHFQAMLRLNPNDNQGVRDSLVNVLIAADRDAEAAELLEQYREDSTAKMAYPRALLAFRREGDSFEARRCLKKALQANPFVPGLLLGTRRPLPPSETYSLRSEEEAALYFILSSQTWKATPGALDWLKSQTKMPPKHKGTRRAEKRRKKKRRR